MDTIRSYIENIFTNLPRTEQVLRVKAEMLANMEEKYHEFKQEGRSKNEAVGKVISEFGNIDELLAELGVATPVDSKRHEHAHQVSREEAENWLRTKKRTGFLVALGVFLCITGAATLIFLSSALERLYWLSDSLMMGDNPAAGIISLLVMVAVAVGLFIYSGIKTEQFDFLKKDFVLNGSLQKWVEDQKNEFLKIYTISLIVGVMICILAPLVIILPLVLSDASDLVIQLVVAMILLIGIAAFLFTYFGNIKEAYDRLLKIGDYKYEPENKKFLAISSAIWPLATITFFLIGFLGGRWDIAWIVFPITGLLFAAITGIIKAVKGEKH